MWCHHRRHTGGQAWQLLTGTSKKNREIAIYSLIRLFGTSCGTQPNIEGVCCFEHFLLLAGTSEKGSVHKHNDLNVVAASALAFTARKLSN